MQLVNINDGRINLIFVLRPLISLKDLLSFYATKVLRLFQNIHKFPKLDWAYPVSVSYTFSGLSYLSQFFRVSFFNFLLTKQSFYASTYSSFKCKFSYIILRFLKVYAQSKHFKEYFLTEYFLLKNCFGVSKL